MMGPTAALTGLRPPGGRFRCVGGRVSIVLQMVTLGSLLGPATGRRMGSLAVQQGPDRFRPLADRCVMGENELHIDRRFPLGEAPAAVPAR